MSVIEFINTRNIVDKRLFPKPARGSLPDWYKEMPGYASQQPDLSEDTQKSLLHDNGLYGPGTIKKCMPVFDSLSAGYLILLHTDLVVYRKEDSEAPWYRWPDASGQEVAFHEYYQISGYPKAPKDLPLAKFINPWGVRTKTGYSSLFVSPLNRDTPIEILSGTVDTDSYNIPVIFPFLLKDPSWTGLIPAGTPIAQVIPFKRETYSHKVISFDKIKNNKNIEKNREALATSFYKAYKDNFWKRKEYK